MPETGPLGKAQRTGRGGFPPPSLARLCRARALGLLCSGGVGLALLWSGLLVGSGGPLGGGVGGLCPPVTFRGLGASGGPRWGRSGPRWGPFKWSTNGTNWVRHSATGGCPCMVKLDPPSLGLDPPPGTTDPSGSEARAGADPRTDERPGRRTGWVPCGRHRLGSRRGEGPDTGGSFTLCICSPPRAGPRWTAPPRRAPRWYRRAVAGET